MSKCNYQIALSVLLIAAMLFDIITFFRGPVEFEINPVYILTSSVGLMITIKVLYNIGLLWFLWCWKQHKSIKSDIFMFAYVYIILYSILGQFGAGLMNIHTTTIVSDNPGVYHPLNTQQALTVVWNTSVMFMYLPTFITMLAFFIYERMYRKK